MISIDIVDIKDLKKEWQLLENENYYNSRGMTYCQTWDWNYQIFKYWKENSIRKHIIGKFIYLKISRDNETRMIAPLCLKNKKAYIIGRGCGQNYFDLIYGKEFDGECFKALLKHLMDKGYKYLEIPLIREESETVKYINREKQFRCDVSETGVVKLDFDHETYEEYFQSLKKSTKQNIRTAYNRLKKDDMQWKFCCETNAIKSDLASDLMEFYCKRHDKTFNNSSKYEYIKFIIRKLVLGIWQNNKVVYYSMISGFNHKLYSLYIDDKLAAYYYGLVYPNNKISFKHVCINDNYSRYSPGMILAMEILKRDYKKFDVFDFTTGTENYKYRLGCEDEKCYNLQLHL